MVEVHAVLKRGTVFLTGETLECQVTFFNLASNSSHSPKNNASARRDRVEKLAWASAQIHCQCTVGESKVILHKVEGSDIHSKGNESSFMPSRGERGMTVFSSKPTILFCELSLEPGEKKTFTYREKIPADSPPSYKGHSVKYAYKLTIGTQRLESEIKLLPMPFRVIVLHGLNDLSVYSEPKEVGPSNPFLKHSRKENSVLDIALSVLSTMTCRKGPSYYNITNEKGKVARLCLFKMAYKIGEDIIGVFDFSDTDISCVQYSVTLQSEEQISEDCSVKKSVQPYLQSYSKHHEFCLHMQHSHMTLPIPLTVTPGFTTDIVALKWRLHFEFITTKNPMPDMEVSEDPCESTTWRGPETLEVETMVWDMNIKVFATNPIHANSASLLKKNTYIQI